MTPAKAVVNALGVLVCLASGCGGGSRATPPLRQATPPSFWPVPGTYSPTNIRLSDSSPNARIFYTIDGTTPSISSSKYAGQIPISASVTIKAIATASGYSPSAVAVAPYIVPAQNGTGPAVSVVLTTEDESRTMEAQAGTNFTTAGASGNVIYVDESQKYQPIEGFGAAFTDSAAYLLNEVATKSALNRTMSDLFTLQGKGIGLSFMRTPMAASDLARTLYSYDDNNGQADPTLAGFSVAHDQADILPIMLRGRQLNPQMKLLANPWSPPGWMKTNGSMVGGGLASGMYASLASYFVKYLQAYATAGIPVDYISVQNEPSVFTSDYPGSCMPAFSGGSICKQAWPTDETTLIRDFLLPSLAAANLNTRVLLMDDGWAGSSYASSLLSDPTIRTSPQVAGTAWHGYFGPPGVMTTFNNSFPSKGNYETEHSGFTTNAEQLKLDFEEITHVMRSWGRAYVKWSLALDEKSGPHTGGCTACTGIVTVNSSSGAVTYGIEFYTLGHFSKYVRPGAVRVYSSNAPGIVSVAFRNSDGSKALIVFNDSLSNQSFQVQWGTQAFAYTLPSFAGATFTWNGAQNGSYAVDAKSQIEASSFNSTGGLNVAGDNTTFGLQTEATSDTNGGYDAGFSADGDYAIFKNVNFGVGVTGIDARLACNPGNGGNCGTVEFRLDSISGTLITSVLVPTTASWQTWNTVSASAGAATGIHDLYVIFKAPASGTSNLGNLNWFQFN